MNWSLAEETALRGLAAQCLPASVIAGQLAQLGFRPQRTRNAVIGKMMRHGICNQGAENNTRRQHTTRLKRQAATVPLPRPRPPDAPPPPPPPPPPSTKPHRIGKVITLMDLRYGDCHFPVGDSSPAAYCGQPTGGGRPYCSDHWKVMYRPVR